jgi:WD40 repeat protein
MNPAHWLLPLLLAAAAPVAAGPTDAVVFSRDVAPILVQKCQGCHNAQKHKGGYRIDTFEHLMRPGDSEAAPVAPGQPPASEVWRLITSPDEKKRMPQKDDALPAAHIALIERWIQQGARFDGPDRTAPLQSLAAVAHSAAPATYPHPIPATALAFSPDAGALAANGYHEVTLWNPTTGQLLRRLGDVAQQTQALSFSPDGSLLAVAGGTPGSLGELRLIPLHNTTPSTPRVLDRIADVMLSLGFSPDGIKLAAGGADGTLRLYAVSTGERTLKIEPHADWVTAVAFSPDGSKVATASRDKSARVFDAATGDLLSAYPNHEQPLSALAWSTDGKRLFTAGREREVHVWEPSTEAKKVREMKGFPAEILRLAVLGDRCYSTCADGKLRVHDATSGQLLKTIDVTDDYLPGLATHPRTNTIAAGAFDGSVHLYDAATLAPRGTFVASPGHERRSSTVER